MRSSCGGQSRTRSIAGVEKRTGGAPEPSSSTARATSSAGINRVVLTHLTSRAAYCVMKFRSVAPCRSPLGHHSNWNYLDGSSQVSDTVIRALSDVRATIAEGSRTRHQSSPRSREIVRSEARSWVEIAKSLRQISEILEGSCERSLDVRRCGRAKRFLAERRVSLPGRG